MPKATAIDVFERLTEHLDTEAPAETPDGDATPEENDEAAQQRAAPARPHRVAAALVAALLIAALAYSAYSSWRLHQADSLAVAEQDALSAAKDYAITLTTLDVNDIDGNYARAIDGATGAFKDAYSLGAKQLRQILIDNKASGKGVVVDAAVKSATSTRVEVLLFVDQSVTNAVRSEPRIDRNRIQMTMELVGGQWLAGQVDLV